MVLNSHDVDATQRFFEQALGFRLADRTRIMAFMNCNRDHHSIALGDTDNDALNHIAFLMPDLESVMRGGGRMKDAGYAIEWGPGRHGPGNNAFNYFIGPFGVVIEYTAEVAADRRQLPCRAAPTTGSGRPAASTSGASRSRPSARLKEAQRAVLFVADCLRTRHEIHHLPARRRSRASASSTATTVVDLNDAQPQVPPDLRAALRGRRRPAAAARARARVERAAPAAGRR